MVSLDAQSLVACVQPTRNSCYTAASTLRTEVAVNQTRTAGATIHDVAPVELQRAAELAETVIKDTTANPAPLGLMGFGLTTVLLNLHNAGIIGIGSMILSMGIFYGGVAQIIAGAMEWKKKNTFGMVAFTSYGFFWISLVALIVMPRFGIVEASDKNAMAAYLFLWGVFSMVLFIATLRMNRAIMLVFFSLVILFILLGLGDATGNPVITRIAGYEGILCGLGAMYLGAAQILNEVYGRKVLPIGEL
jgi:succinate-acetate transporter protein